MTTRVLIHLAEDDWRDGNPTPATATSQIIEFDCNDLPAVAQAMENVCNQFAQTNIRCNWSIIPIPGRV